MRIAAPEGFDFHHGVPPLAGYLQICIGRLPDITVTVFRGLDQSLSALTHRIVFQITAIKTRHANFRCKINY